MYKAIICHMAKQKNIPEDLIKIIYEFVDETFINNHKKMVLMLKEQYDSYIYYFYNYALAPWISGDQDLHWKEMRKYYINFNEFYNDIDNTFDYHYYALREEVKESNNKFLLAIKKNPFYKVFFEKHFTIESVILCEELVHNTWS